MTFRMDPNDPRWKLAESEAFKVLSRLQDDDGFADAIHEASLRLGTNVKRRPIRPRSEIPSSSNGRIVLMDIRESGVPVGEAVGMIAEYQHDPRLADYDIRMDGDLYAIVAIPKLDPDQPIIGRRMLP